MGSADSKSEALTQSMKLFTAISLHDWKLAVIMINKGADINCINFSGRTPLMETCRISCDENIQEQNDFVGFLLNHGALVEGFDIYGLTAQIYAKDTGLKSIALKLQRKVDRASIIEKRQNSS